VNPLSDRQLVALREYQAMLKAEPRFFAPRAARPLVTSADQMEEYAARSGAVLGVVAQTPYFLLLNDLVRSRAAAGSDGLHAYLRIISKATLVHGANAVVLATLPKDDPQHPGAIILVEQERHALGTVELELPRGFGEPGLDGAALALRELREETGYVGSIATRLGVTNTDSGLTDSQVAFYHVEVESRGAAMPEQEEALGNVRLLSEANLWQAIMSGHVRDGFTLQALALFGRRALAGGV
jgi:ADP-ribose pyrophosphatase